MGNIKTVLVGLGPHARRIYMSCFKNRQMQPTLIVDLESKRDFVQNYIKDNSLDSKSYFIEDRNRDAQSLSDKEKEELKKIIQDENITHAIISTEPKAHYAYICFFLENNISVLADKPLTAPSEVSTDISMAKKIQQDYYDIRALYNKARENNTMLQIQCQRRWHKGYLLANKLASDTVKKYNIPITSIQLSHCDGMWNMPDEFVSRENHPYKYGYGKLFHSGYHFVDIIAWFESINENLISKAPDNIELYATAVRPNDFMQMINKQDYWNLFNDGKFDNIFDNADKYKFDKYGEIDFHSIMQFKHNNDVISTVNLNLMQNGFSRRAWNCLPEDTYKNNGRVRHEYMNIEIGPLMNIQIHSYQSKEIKDRTKGKYTIGEVEHFNVYVFRNVELIGGEPMVRYTLEDLYDNMDVQGSNEDARKRCFNEFIDSKVEGDPLYDHELGIQILSKGYEALCEKYKGNSGMVRFRINHSNV